jgi:hypothetical protein
MFSADSRIRDVLAIGPGGRRLLWQHGYDVGEGFVDLLSQYQTLDDADRAGRLRDLPGLISELEKTAATKS